MLPPKVEEPTGGVVDEEDYAGQPAEVKIAVVPEELPVWFIMPPVICPHYTQYYRTYHKAVDLINLECNGSDWIVAVADGNVSMAGYIGGYGNRIEITHANGMVSTYSHLSKISVNIGEEVKMGQKIGIIGSTGRSTGTHVHFEIIYQGVKINPDLYLVR